MMKKFTPLFILLFAMMSHLNAQTARIQIIHNSPDHTTKALDVYFGNQKVVDSLPFRYATDYMSAPANTPIVMALQSPSLSDTNASLTRQTISLDADSAYVLIISGLISSKPYDSLKPFEVNMHRSREMARLAGNVDLLFFNGGTDAPGITIDELTGSTVNFLPLLKYGEFSNFVEVANQDYEFRVVDNNTKQTIAPYFADFNTLGLADSAAVIVVSGLIDTSQSLPGDSSSAVDAPLFGLFMALPGGGPLIELPAKSGIGVDELGAERITLYPNPANNMLEISFPTEINGEVKIEILNMRGKPMLDTTVYNHSNEVHKLRVASLSSGYYLLKAKSGSDWIYTAKILIE